MQISGSKSFFKMFFAAIFWLLCFGWVSSCNTEPPDTDSEVQDSVAVALGVTIKDSAVFMKNSNALWLTKTVGAPNLQWSKLQLENYWSEDTLDWQPFAPGETFYKDYQSVLYWSPDSSYLLDVGSYGLMVVKDENGNTTLEAGDPDTEIAVIVPSKNEKARLMFAGPASYIMGGKWLDSTQASIVGTFDKENSVEKDTLVWMIDIKKNFFRLYNFKAARN